MKQFLCLIIIFLTDQSISSQNQLPQSSLNELVNEYNEIFIFSKSVADELTQPFAGDADLLPKITVDLGIGTIHKVRNTDVLVSGSSLDFGLKWVSDVTYNFRPGIGENEDVFFRSRIATGLDWVILGEGSIQQKKESKRLYQQQLLKDSLQFKLNNNSLHLHRKHVLLEHIFDMHRLDILKKYQQMVQLQAQYQQKMFLAGLTTEATKINANNQLRSVNDMVNVYEMYMLDSVPSHLVKQYYNIPYTDVALADLSSITIDGLLIDEERLMKLQNDYLLSRQRPNEKPSLRAKFRYNYYDSEQQNGRSFASIGASLTVPIRSGKDNQQAVYQINTNKNNLYYEKLKLKDKLVVLHKSFYLLKNKLFKLQNDLIYIESLLKNEANVYNRYNKDFSPAKYIEYVEMLIHKKLDVLEVKQQLCESYINFQSLSGLQAEDVSANF